MSRNSHFRAFLVSFFPVQVLNCYVPFCHVTAAQPLGGAGKKMRRPLAMLLPLMVQLPLSLPLHVSEGCLFFFVQAIG